MPAISTFSPTGDPYIDSVLSGTKWATNSLSFSFPTSPSVYGSPYGRAEEPSNNFEAFTAVQQAAVQDVLNAYSSIANLTFTGVTETSTQHGDLRYAETDATNASWAYRPNTADIGGDVWVNNSGDIYENPVRGTYAYVAFLHETGHAMGFKHPFEVEGSFGTMPLDHDSTEYSVMTYRPYIGGATTGFLLSPTSYPQTLMMYDIAALQTAYGANYTTQSGDTIYRWNAGTGQEFINGVGQGSPAANRIFMTLWDGGGHDTYDFSNYTSSLTVDLNPGGWTTVSANQLANLGDGHFAAGNIANALLFQGNPASLIEDAIGGSANDTIIGNQANNALKGNGGNDIIDGSAGTDKAIYSGASTDYQWSENSNLSWNVADLRPGSPDGTDLLKNMESAQFTDRVIPIAAPFAFSAEMTDTALSVQPGHASIIGDLSTAPAGEQATGHFAPLLS